MSGDRCVYCGAPVLWHGPGGVVFGDNSAAHLRCYEEHEAAREAAKAANAKHAGHSRGAPPLEANGHAEPLEEAEA